MRRKTQRDTKTGDEEDLSTGMYVRPDLNTSLRYAPSYHTFLLKHQSFAEVFSTWPVESLAVGMVHHRCQPAGSVTSNETCEPSFTASLIMRAAVWLVSK